MALEMQDLMALKSMGGNGDMTPYEQFKVQNMQAKSHTSGIGVAGLVLGTVGTAIGIGAWIFNPLYSNARANQAKEVAVAAKEIAALRNEATQRQLDQLTSLLAAERSERLQGDYTISQTITDTVSGSQQGQLTATQQAELSQAQQLMFGLSTGEYSKNPMRVVRVSGTRECPCDSGCGCNG